MPNYVAQKITCLTDGFKTIEDIMNKYCTDGMFDFEKLIPMPEELKVEVSSNSKNGFVLYVHDLKDPILKHTILTKKSALNKGEYDESEYDERYNELRNIVRKGSPEEQKMLALGEAIAKNLIKYGYTDWYEWSCDKWGTKWNASHTRTGKIIGEWHSYVQFDTAWNEARPIIEELSRRYPDSAFGVKYAEETMDYGGTFDIRNGEITNDVVYDRSDAELKSIHRDLFGDID